MLNEPRKEMGEVGAELGIEDQSKSPVFLQEDYDLGNTNVVRSEGYATMFIDPDVIEFFLRADSIKDSAEEVKTSISKRIDYLLQVVKSKIQGEKNISVHELLDKRDDMYTMSAEILVKCGSLQKYEEIRNIVVEKLGGTVFVSEPRHYHTHRCLQDASGETQKNITRCLRTFEKTERSRTLFSFKTARNKMSDSAEYADVSKSNQRWQYLRRVWRPLPLSLLFATVGVVQWNYIKKKHTKEPVEEAKDWEVTCYRSVPLRLVSRSWGWFSNLELPEPLRTRLISAYITKFGCNLEEAAVTNLSAYRSLADFFCRELRHDARPIAATDCLVSPADGSVVNIGRVSSSKVEQVKGVTYTLEAFLGPHTWKPVSQEDNGGGTADQEYQKSLLHNKNNVLYQYVVYLAPGDYHRFHSPVDWDVIFRRHFQGELLSVNPVVAQVVPELFSLNERAVYIGQWKHGFFSMTAVGATNVGCIRVYCDPSLKTNERKWRRGEKRRDLFLSGEGGGPVHIEKGELFGEFRMGSTIVVLFEAPPDFTFRVEHGQRILVGEAISECLA